MDLTSPITCPELVSGRLRCVLSPLGASVARLQRKDPDGSVRDLVLPSLSLLDGSPDPSLTGRTVGPCCGRIRDARIRISGEEYPLTRNEGANHIHGGPDGLPLRVWEISSVSPDRVCFSADLPDGLDGYPGNRHFTAEYTLLENSLSVHYTAVSDRETFVDMTNHAYFDLSGRFDGSAMRQRLFVRSSSHVRNDASHLPVSVAPSAGTAFDFLSSPTPAGVWERYPGEPQLSIGRGWNNALILEKDAGPAATLTAPDGRLRMDLFTDAPCIVLYTGGFLDASTRLPQGPAGPACAIALEAQGLPDAFHLPGARPQLLRPGETFHRRIRWTVSDC